MLAVLVGITNRTNWKKPNTQRGSFSITVQESEHTHTIGQARTHQHGAPFLFAYSPKGKKKTQNPQAHKNKQGIQEDKQRTTKVKPQKIDKEHKRRANTRIKGEKERQIRRKPFIRLTPHAHKSHTIQAKHPSQAITHETRETR